MKEGFAPSSQRNYAKLTIVWEVTAWRQLPNNLKKLFKATADLGEAVAYLGGTAAYHGGAAAYHKIRGTRSEEDQRDFDPLLLL
jgi:hypothetical protein